MDDFEKELKCGFLEEAAQLLSEAEQCFLQLEANPADPNVLNQIFRLAHNLKGSGKAVGFDELGAFTHTLESVLLKLKSGELSADSSTVGLLLRCNDHLNYFLTTLRGDLTAHVDSTELSNELHALLGGGAKPAPTLEPTSAESPPAVETAPAVATPEFSKEPSTPEVAYEWMAQETTKHLEPQPSASPAVAPAAAPAAAPSKTPTTTAAAVDESIRVSTSRLEKLLNFVGEMVILQTVLREQAQSTQSLLLRKTVHQLGKVTKEVQDISMGLRMVPLKQTFQKMQRIVRDTAALLNKKVHLEIEGEDTELDKTVLENLGDPLVHLIRNAVDHGVESGETRVKNGKPEQGTVTLRALHRGGKMLIEVQDDGGGLNAEKLVSKAIEKGVLRPGTKLSQADALNLIFAPGFSTKAEVTEVSGRGVGMDVVKRNIEKLQGNIQIETELGKGTCFRIELPLTLAIIDGMIIKLGEDRFVIPLSQVHESVRPGLQEIQTKNGLGEVLLLRGEPIPLYRLSQLLGKRGNQTKNEDGIAIVVRNGGLCFSVFVDDIVSQHQVVIKKLGKEIHHLTGFAGSAILGDGKPALILEVTELVKKARPVQAPTLGRTA